MGWLHRKGHSSEESTCLRSSRQSDQCVEMQPTPAHQDHFLLANCGFCSLLLLWVQETDKRPTETLGRVQHQNAIRDTEHQPLGGRNQQTLVRDSTRSIKDASSKEERTSWAQQDLPQKALTAASVERTSHTYLVNVLKKDARGKSKNELARWIDNQDEWRR